MRCTSCHRSIAAGVEAQKMVVEYRQADGRCTLHGYMMSDGPLSAARGQMLRGWHFKCYHIARKREARGDAVTGRVLSGTPTGYDIDQLVLTKDDLDTLGITAEQARQRSTVQLSAQLARLREIAQGIGKGVGDATVQEAFQAEQHGGPYPHQHHHRLEMYQLLAHLQFAHGWSLLPGTATTVQDQHSALHARAALDAIRADRVADSEPDYPPRDWRTQYTTEL